MSIYEDAGFDSFYEPSEDDYINWNEANDYANEGDDLDPFDGNEDCAMESYLFGDC